MSQMDFVHKNRGSNKEKATKVTSVSLYPINRGSRQILSATTVAFFDCYHGFYEQSPLGT